MRLLYNEKEETEKEKKLASIGYAMVSCKRLLSFICTWSLVLLLFLGGFQYISNSLLLFLLYFSIVGHLFDYTVFIIFHMHRVYLPTHSKFNIMMHFQAYDEHTHRHPHIFNGATLLFVVA